MTFYEYTSMTNTHSGLYRYGLHAKIVHFLGGTKPWHLSYDPQAANESSLSNSSNNFQQFMNLWWVEYYTQKQQQVQKDDKNEDYVRVHSHQMCFLLLLLYMAIIHMGHVWLFS